MPPDAGQQVPADAQRNGREIASAVEQGIANHDLSQAIQLIQQTERNLAGKPQDLKSALEVANRELEKSQNPTVQKYFARRDITGTDPTKGGLVLTLDQGQGEKIMVGRDGRAYSIEKANAVKEERTVTREGNHETIKYTSPDGKQTWQVDRARHADGTLRPYKVTRPDGTSSLYLWERTTPNGPVEPVGMVDVDAKGQALRNYELAKRPDGSRVPGVWQKMSGPPGDFPRIYGKLEVAPNGTHRFRMEGYNKEGQDVQANQVLTINPDGTMKKEAGQPPQRAQQPGPQRRPRS